MKAATIDFVEQLKNTERGPAIAPAPSANHCTVIRTAGPWLAQAEFGQQRPEIAEPRWPTGSGCNFLDVSIRKAPQQTLVPVHAHVTGFHRFAAHGSLDERAVRPPGMMSLKVRFRMCLARKTLVDHQE
jgi:hypothetical protein